MVYCTEEVMASESEVCNYIYIKHRKLTSSSPDVWSPETYVCLAAGKFRFMVHFPPKEHISVFKVVLWDNQTICNLQINRFKMISRLSWTDFHQFKCFDISYTVLWLKFLSFTDKTDIFFRESIMSPYHHQTLSGTVRTLWNYDVIFYNFWRSITWR